MSRSKLYYFQVCPIKTYHVLGPIHTLPHLSVDVEDSKTIKNGKDIK